MKRLLASVLLLLTLSGLAPAAYFQAQTYLPPAASNPNLRQENINGLTGAAWQNPFGYYVPGTGSPAISTADWLHVDGPYLMRPVDLTSADCGSAGTTAAAAFGRYAWVMSPDHPSTQFSWRDGIDFYIGFSNDPSILPSTVRSFYSQTQVNPTPQIATVTASISNGAGGAGNFLDVTVVSGFITNAGQAKVLGAGVTTATINSQSSGTSGTTGRYVISGAAQNVASQAMTVQQTNAYLYQAPTLVCNADDPSNTFNVYGEGVASSVQHQEGLLKSNDLITWSASPTPSHVALDFNTWSSFQNVIRDGVNQWHSTGLQVGYPQNGNTFSNARWTSTDGSIWTLGSVSINSCLPANPTTFTTSCGSGSTLAVGRSNAPDNVLFGAQAWNPSQLNTNISGSRLGQQWAGRVPVDSNSNVLASPTVVKVSRAYSGIYPSPDYINDVNAYVEDGIVHYYAKTGYFPSRELSSGDTLVPAAPYLNGGGCITTNDVGAFSFVGGISNGSGGAGTILNVTSLITNNVRINGIISGSGVTSGTKITAPGNGGTGNYTVSASQLVAPGTTFTGFSCGGLWQGGIDHYTEIYDATAAAGAAPVGVKASCASSTSTINWLTGILPTDTTRLYRGTTAVSQTTLVGDFSGGIATDTGMTLNSVTYYKLVYLNAGVEKKNRVVSTYCSTSSAAVNAHMTRALAAGADSTTCNRAGTGLSMDAFDNWLSSNSRTGNLLFATAADFCVAKSGSVISKIFDMGTTRLPRGGDYTTTTGSTTYNATGINSKPAWVNGTNTAQGYYGGGRFNQIRRKTQITLFAAYQKPGTGQITPLAWGEIGGMKMTHTTGSPGTISCQLYDASGPATATKAVAGLATDVHTAACTYDPTNGLVAWSDAVAGTPATTLVIPSPNLNPPDALTGAVTNDVILPFLGSGSASLKYTSSYIFSNNEALYNGRAQMVLDIALPGSEITSLDALVR